VHSCFLDPALFPSMRRRFGSAKHPKCFASARTVSLQPLGPLRARIASSFGDKLRAQAQARDRLVRACNLAPMSPQFSSVRGMVWARWDAVPGP
jgi:L-asparaginase II